MASKDVMERARKRREAFQPIACELLKDFDQLHKKCKHYRIGKFSGGKKIIRSLSISKVTLRRMGLIGPKVVYGTKAKSKPTSNKKASDSYWENKK